MGDKSKLGRQPTIDHSPDAIDPSMGSPITSAQSDTKFGSTLGLTDLLDDGGRLALPASSADAHGPSRAAHERADDRLTILILGDSYMTKGSPLFAALDRELNSTGFDVKLVTKAKGGAFLADGAGQLSAGLKAHKGIDAVLVMLGSNDSLGARSIEQAERSLDSILTKLDKKGLPALVAGTYGDWPVQGQGYDSATDQNRFEAMFGRQAAKHGDILYESILDGAYGVGGRTSDGEHPNANGAAVIANRMSSALDDLVTRAAFE